MEKSNKVKGDEKMKLLFTLVLGFSIFLACEGKQGPVGPTGPQGPEGPAGVSLIKEYTGTIPSDGHYTLDTPEITGKRGTTFVMAYWTFSTTPNIWQPMTDGWVDDFESAHIFSVSWTYGQVLLLGMLADDLYLVQVFEHN